MTISALKNIGSKLKDKSSDLRHAPYSNHYASRNDSIIPFHRFAYLINYHRQICVFATDDSYNLKDYYLAIRCVKD